MRFERIEFFVEGQGKGNAEQIFILVDAFECHRRTRTRNLLSGGQLTDAFETKRFGLTG